MARLQLRGPDGASRQATGSFGRTDFSPEDTTISRLQFTVEPVENAIILTCRGANGAPGSDAGPPAARPHVAAHDF